MNAGRLSMLVVLLSFLGGCQSVSQQPLPTAQYVDLPRFMGDWYVIAFIPIFVEKDAHNAVENYQLSDKGSIQTVYRFRDGGFEGPLKEYESTGFVEDESGNAVWSVQFFWPFKADYRVMFVDASYELTVVGRQKRDYVWIMARSPTISEGSYRRMVEMVRDAGYDLSQLRKVPQRWPERSQ